MYGTASEIVWPTHSELHHWQTRCLQRLLSLEPFALVRYKIYYLNFINIYYKKLWRLKFFLVTKLFFFVVWVHWEKSFTVSKVLLCQTMMFVWSLRVYAARFPYCIRFLLYQKYCFMYTKVCGHRSKHVFLLFLFD